MTFPTPRTLILATLALILCAGSSPAEDRDLKAAAFSNTLAGDWEGTLEYRDYSTDKRLCS
jgi:hypothetical protein